eukprot:TRINITY_DN14548_c0_g1_i1.p1 TRINITY_DN14548_c0_g1~~TRINITY_DN14548_c0_g1_i1.p1  ORF type:complete len:404 (-),score=76.53 TRINITY_DN14548_c0_g1_i1:174-1361(-)
MNSLIAGSAVTNSHVPLLEWLQRFHKDSCDWVRAFYVACLQGHVEILDWLYERREDLLDSEYEEWKEDLCYAAAFKGNIDALIWARNHGCPWNANTMAGAIASGKYNVVRWAMENGCPVDSGDMRHAATCGNNEIFRSLLDRGFDWDPNAIACGVAGSGNLELLKWVIERGACVEDSDIFVYAIRFCNGDTEILDFLKKAGCPLPRKCDIFASTGNIDLVKWARSNLCKFDVQTCVNAAASGSLELLKWLRECNCPWHWKTTEEAAVNQNWDIVKWAVLNGCPVTSDTCAAAAHHGEFEMVKWLLDCNCSIDTWTAHNAAVEGHWSLFKWLVNKGCPVTDSSLELAERLGGPRIAEWAREKLGESKAANDKPQRSLSREGQGERTGFSFSPDYFL